MSNKTNYSGVELDNFSIKKHNYKYYKRIKFYKGDFLTNKSIKINYYDVIIFNGVFEHLLDLKKTMKFIDRTLKKGGLVFINLPNDFNILQNYYLRVNGIKKIMLHGFLLNILIILILILYRIFLKKSTLKFR